MPLRRHRKGTQPSMPSIDPTDSNTPQGCGPPPQISSYLGWPTSLKIPRSRQSPQFAQDVDVPSTDLVSTTSEPGGALDSTPISFPMTSAHSAPTAQSAFIGSSAFNRSSTSSATSTSTTSSLSSITVTTPNTSDYNHDFFPPRPYTSPPDLLLGEETVQSVGVVTERNKYVLLISLPKFYKDDITLSARRTKTLHIVADKYDDQGGHFERKITFGQDADFSSISADFDGNVLVVTVPRRQVMDFQAGLGLIGTNSTSSGHDNATMMPHAKLSDWSLDRFWAAAAKATAHDWKIVEEYAALTKMSSRLDMVRETPAQPLARGGSPFSASDSPSTASPSHTETPSSSSMDESSFAPHETPQWGKTDKCHYRGMSKEALLEEDEEEHGMDGVELQRAGSQSSSQRADPPLVAGGCSSMDCSEDFPKAFSDAVLSGHHRTNSISPTHEMTVAMAMGLELSPGKDKLPAVIEGDDTRGRPIIKPASDTTPVGTNIVSSSIPSHMRFGTANRHTRSRSRTGIRHSSLPPAPSAPPTESSVAGDTAVSDGEGSVRSTMQDDRCLSRQVSYEESMNMSLSAAWEKENNKEWTIPRATGSPPSTNITPAEPPSETARPALARSGSSALTVSVKPMRGERTSEGSANGGRKSPFFWKRWT